MNAVAGPVAGGSIVRGPTITVQWLNTVVELDEKNHNVPDLDLQ